MTINISDNLLSRFSEYLSARMGLFFPVERRRELEQGIRSAARDFCLGDAESCVHWLMSSPLAKNQVEVLAKYFTVGETYFFREKRSFEILEKRILSDLIQSRRGKEQSLRIWSAGCSTGEEPYSIAILLSKMIPDLRNWNVNILATDINPLFLQKALEGVYSQWSFRDVPPLIKERYFKEAERGRFGILPHLKSMVKFSYLNLAEDEYPSFLNNTGMMDVILCRNVLIYFTPEQKEKVIKNFYRSLVDGGWLMVSPAETLHVQSSQFVPVNFNGAIFFKKEQRETIPEQDCQSAAPLFMLNTLNVLPEQQKNQKPPQNLYAEALMLYDLGRYAEVERQLLENYSGNEWCLSGKITALLARSCANQGKLAEALEWCEKAVAAEKLNPGFHYLHATILQEQGQAEEAVIALKRALYLDQNFVLAHFSLGNVTRQQGRTKESDKHFNNAIRLLSGYSQEDILPESDGITAGRLLEIIASMNERSS